jgi:hypothetical protein
MKKMIKSRVQNANSIHGLGGIHGLGTVQNMNSTMGLGIIQGLGTADGEVSEHGCSQYFNRHQKMALK